MKRIGLFLLAVVMVGAFAPGVSHAAWPTKTASRCWEITDVPGSLLRLRIAPFGGGTHLLAGSALMNGAISVISGNAVFRGGDVIIGLNGIVDYDAGNIYRDHMGCVVNRKNLTGYCWWSLLGQTVSITPLRCP